MSKVLFVEDAPEFHLIVKRAFSSSDITLDCVSSAAEADEALKKDDIDLILLDIGLPDGNGFELFKKWQSNQAVAQIPVIIVTGQGELSDKLLGFSLGAEDYIVKPFEPLELRARIENRLKKAKKKTAVNDILRKDCLSIRVPFQKASIIENGKERDLGLTPVEFKLLYYLAANDGRAVSTNELLKTVWGDDVHVVGQSVYTHISALRRKLSNSPCSIESAPSGGYRFRSSSDTNSR